MLEAGLKSKIDKLWDLFWSGGIANPLTAIEQISYLLFMKKLDDQDIKKKKESKFVGKSYRSIFQNNKELCWSHWKHFESEQMLNHVRDKVFPFIKNLNSNSDNGFSAQMKDAVFIIPKPSLLVQAVEIIESLKIHEQNQDTQGDIYEYLLSELQTSGKNGQFRTPRHIIKMMCELTDIRIGQSVCDPSCGTGGFLIGAYQYLLRQHTSPQLITIDKEGMEHGLVGDKITSSKIWSLLRSKTFYGFDFDSTMLRISAMNMALHGIKNPNIKYLDSISKSNEEENRYDVILANPPFKGNIDKGDIHSALSRTVKTTRTELLFVAQMMRLLKVGGQCAVIVPSGVLFRSDKAHTAIRKKIVEEAQLSAVISMPSGVFKPYAGVSTVILLFTKGGETDKVWFYDMTADGFSLDDKRNKITENDIPDILEKWKQRHKLKEPMKKDKWFFVSKKKIVENSDYSLNGRIYKEAVDYSQTKWPMVELGEIADVISGQSPESKYYNKKGEGLPFYQGKTEFSNIYLGKPVVWTNKTTKIAQQNDILMSVRAPVGPVNISTEKICIGRGLATIRAKDKVNMKFLFYFLKSISSQIRGVGGSVFDSINQKQIKQIKIPLPPLEIQKEIVDEIEGYQKIIDGAKQIVDNWKPTLKVDPSWSMVELGEVADITSGQSPESKFYNKKVTGLPFYQGKTEFSDIYLGKPVMWTNKTTKIAKQNDILMSVRAPVGPVNISTEKICIGRGLASIRAKDKVNMNFLFYFLKSISNEIRGVGGSVFDSINQKQIKQIKIPLPSLKIQKEIVGKIEKEKSHIESCKELIKINKEKIQHKINEVWQE